MEDGIYDNINIQDYHADREYISATGIKMAKKSLRLYDWNYNRPVKQEEKIHFDFGNSFELALLDKIGFEKAVAIRQTETWTHMANMARIQETGEPYKSPKLSAVYKAEDSKFEAYNEGKYIIPDIGPQSFQVIECMLESCMRDSVIKKLIEGTEYQLSLFWTDEETGLKMKTRPDICKRKKNVIVNLKTIEDGSPEKFSRDLCNYDYPLQAAVEITGCLKTGLMPDVDNYFWLVVEKSEPYNATIYEFDKSDISHSMDELAYYKNKIAQAKKENLFPGYSDRADNPHGILTARIPSYYYNL